MRQLEVVAVSDDGNHLLLAASEEAARATHQIRIDNRLVAAINGELDDDSEHRESELSPKEIQARLRAGETVEQVAKAARIPVSRIMIYATPVISERDRIVDQARAAKLTRPRGPETTVPLGQLVTERLADVAGLRPETVEWSAKRREDGAWVISLGYSARGGSRTALWLWRPNGRVLTSLNALGTRLGAAEAPPAARKSKPKPRPAPAPARRTPAKRATTPTKRAAAPAKSTSRSPRKASATQPKPVRRGPRPAPRQAPTMETKRTENGRVIMPSWDDVLLGVGGAPTAASRGRRRS
ncbi:MAG TPA: septation protein SepH [Mycobacteriales bacterium]|nr:septation protein SepH [Mycobacteriales bacterium]